ncbi:MAG: hypothetical protein ABIJ09_24485 [Pseudomonadota bacterium]
MSKIQSTRNALTHGIQNDRKGTISEKDAKNIIEAAVGEIARSDKPKETFEANKRYVAAAEALLGKDPDAREALEGYEKTGLNAVTARLAAMTGQTQLPHDAEQVFVGRMKDILWGADDQNVAVSNVRGNVRDGFTVDFVAGANSGTAYLMAYEGNWIPSPVKLEKKDLDAAKAAMQSYFDENWVPELKDDHSDAEIKEMRDALLPESVFFPFQDSDPYNFSVDYPVCFQMNNPTGSDHGFYVGLKPATGEAEAYDFN